MDHGFSSIYQNSEVNNHPVPLYILKLFTFLFQSSSEINASTVNYTKAFYIVFDFLSLGLVVHWLHKGNISIHYIWLLILNPAFWYNTVIWIQCDSLHTFFILLSLYFALNQKTVLSFGSMSLALATKLQAIIFLPFLLLILLPQLREQPKRISMGISTFVGILLLVMLPFMLHGTFKEAMFAISSRSLDFYPVVSVSAYNLWYLFIENPSSLSDATTLAGLSLKTWGLLFVGSLFILLLFLVRSFIKKKKNSIPTSYLSFIFLVFTLVCIIFFYFNTQMHERYIHPAIIFGGLYAIYSKNYGIYILVSAAYLLNLEAIMQIGSYLNSSFSQFYDLFFFNPIFISMLIFVSILFAFIGVYKSYKLQLE